VPDADTLTIESHRGPYTVVFGSVPFRGLDAGPFDGRHFIVDARVAELYKRELGAVLASPSVLRIGATEPAKSLERFPAYVEHLVGRGVRRDHRLVAIGGGIIQDITAFIASTLLRGVDWEFHPTTLLAQADSCIGSKSSINSGSTKNILGTFWPPRAIYISTAVQATLAETDVRSGVGEMLKVHAVDGPQSFDAIAADYERLFADAAVMQRYLRRSLEIKHRLVEADEFDRGPRLVMNYGHSFGHAIEAATDFGVPHGIAVTLGMDMANFIASRIGRLDSARFSAMHGVLSRNARGYTGCPVPAEAFHRALGKDKKNRGDRLTLILPDRQSKIEKVEVANDAGFRTLCSEYLKSVRNS
jgi:3-dehydroquinate synthase